MEDVNGIGVLYTKTGEYSAVLRMENPVQKYSANIDSYYDFTSLLTAVAQTLGEAMRYTSRTCSCAKQFEDVTGDRHEFLSSAYFRYFKGRMYTDSVCYLTITQESRTKQPVLFRRQEVARLPREDTQGA